MRAIGRTTSLESYFRQQAIRWASIGFVLTLFFAIPCVLYSAKVASERQLLIAARSAARAFRPMILEDNIRDTQYQMRKALDLKPEESAIIRDPDLKSIYPLKHGDSIATCSTPNDYCWKRGFRTVSLLYPIFFDDERQRTLYGYLDLTLKPTLDPTVITILITLLLAAFIVQSYGLSSALTQSSKQIVILLSAWADYLRKNPSEQPSIPSPIPFSELHSMQEAIDGLYLEIKKLREKTAQEAKSEAHFSLLREVSHDLKTPLSLVAKYFAIHLDTVCTTGKVNFDEVKRIEKTLRLMGQLIRQVCVIPLNSTPPLNGGAEAICNIDTETKLIIDDFQHDSEVEEKQILIESSPVDSALLKARISKLAYYRILENLIRNAIDAVAVRTGRITVALRMVDGSPALVVKDNGCGISPDVRDRIFAFDFTTKLSRGTGLGLGIVEKICNEFGAILRLESTVGVGTQFIILFQPANRFNETISLGEDLQNVSI